MRESTKPWSVKSSGPCAVSALTDAASSSSASSMKLPELSVLCQPVLHSGLAKRVASLLLTNTLTSYAPAASPSQ